MELLLIVMKIRGFYPFEAAKKLFFGSHEILPTLIFPCASGSISVLPTLIYV